MDEERETRQLHAGVQAESGTARVFWSERRAGDGPGSALSYEGEIIFHSDRGSQFASHDFCVLLDRYGIVASLSRKDLIRTKPNGVLIGVTFPHRPAHSACSGSKFY